MRKIFSVAAGNFILKIIVFTIFLFGALALNGQTVDADTIQVFDVEEEEIHSPKKAAIYSAILPGLGQAYNKKYWKIPLVYAGFGAIGYFIYWNNDNYQYMKVAYGDLTTAIDDGTLGESGSSHSYNELADEYNVDLTNPTQVNNFKTAVSKQQDYYRRNRDLLIISAVGFYALNIIDASVDAHLFDFDISEDLSMNWQPTMQSFNSQTIYGINCSISF